VAAGSTFAILQSAVAGGGGAILVNGVAAGTATGAAIAATAPGLVKAMQEGKKEVTIDDVTYEIDDKGREQSPSPPGQ
jgi:tripartite-type tricarboxylate transporter receptor subunit TctC